MSATSVGARMPRRLSAHRRSTGKAAVLCAIACTLPATAHAFSDPLSYPDAVEFGGGGGRWFTGSSADGYGCDSCHQGGTPADLAVRGLPLDGYVPGTGYEITLLWPAGVQHLALIAELTDEAQQGAGTLALPRPETTSELERCSVEEGGFPAAELHAAEPGRQLVSVIDCGAKLVRFHWTAPSVATSPVWFNAGFVTSDEGADPHGDGVTMVRRPIPVAGVQLAERAVAQGCSVSRFANQGYWPAMLQLWVSAMLVLRCTRKRVEVP